MFIGHYSAALVLKKVEKDVSLGWLFLAVQFVDILFFPFVLLGIEKLNIIENFTQSTHFELEFMPYTHSLVGSLAWAALAYILFRFIPTKGNMNKHRIALVMAVAVFSHWILDLISHTPDLPLLGNTSLKLGFGLWNSAWATFIAEAILLLTGLWLYLKSSKGMTFVGKYGMIIFAVVLIIMNVGNIFGPPPESIPIMVMTSLILYFAIGGAAFWLDGKRA